MNLSFRHIRCASVSCLGFSVSELGGLEVYGRVIGFRDRGVRGLGFRGKRSSGQGSFYRTFLLCSCAAVLLNHPQCACASPAESGKRAWLGLVMNIL